MGSSRVMFAGTGSGCGKTTITCSVLYELIQQNKNVVSFKCGPDYIDPMFHRNIIGAKSFNLDSFFMESINVMPFMQSKLKKADIAIVEGVMGFYDGSNYTTKGSSYEISQLTHTPVILIVNGKGCANSIEAIIKGFVSLEVNNIKGVILNQVSCKTYEKIVPLINKYGLIPCGYVDKLKEELILPNRYLGLDYSDDVTQIKDVLKNVSKKVCQTLDVDAIMSIAEKADIFDSKDDNIESFVADELEDKDVVCDATRDCKVKIAVAKDEAFSFVYQENLDVLEHFGAEIIEFSPVHDAKFPENVDGLLLFGGYPEKYARELSDNKTMLQEIKDHIKNGMPTMAECGGYMYLKEDLILENGAKYDMCGLLNGKAQNCNKLVRFGYITLEAKSDSWLLKQGDKLKAHEFHYWDCENNGNYFTATKTNGDTYDCMYVSENVLAGFPHIYYPANENIALNFVSACKDYRSKINGYF